MLNISYIAIGIVTGFCSGFLGIGGGLLIIPILVYFYGLTQHQAQGTSLAMMVPPITLLAAIRYYYGGNVKFGMATLLAFGFVLGALLGANVVHHMPDILLKRIFGAALLIASLRMIFST